jgi:hypothetical protein
MPKLSARDVGCCQPSAVGDAKLPVERASPPGLFSSAGARSRNRPSEPADRQARL